MFQDFNFRYEWVRRRDSQSIPPNPHDYYGPLTGAIRRLHKELAAKIKDFNISRIVLDFHKDPVFFEISDNQPTTKVITVYRLSVLMYIRIYNYMCVRV